MWEVINFDLLLLYLLYSENTMDHQYGCKGYLTGSGTFEINDLVVQYTTGQDGCQWDVVCYDNHGNKCSGKVFVHTDGSLKFDGLNPHSKESLLA